MKADKLIAELTELTRKNIREVIAVQNLSTEELNNKKNDKSWSILECIEHLNRYGDFYIPEITRCISKGKFEKSADFESGLLGNYFAKSMMPKEKMNKMKTFKSMDPIHSNLDRSVLDTFLEQQDKLLNLLRTSRNVDLTRIKTAISISKYIKLRLGDTFRVVIYHNSRHVTQALRNIKPEVGNSVK